MSEPPRIKSVTVIEGGGSGPKPWRRRSLNECEQITCYKCNGSATVEVTLAPRRAPGGKPVGGTKILACAFCLARGELVELSRK